MTIIFINIIDSPKWNSSKKLIHLELGQKLESQKKKVSEQLKFVSLGWDKIPYSQMRFLF